MKKQENALEQIAASLSADLNRQLMGCGLMFRLFSRVKTLHSVAHKMRIKGEGYLSGKSKIQDIIGLRIVTYFPDDVELLSLFFSCHHLVKQSVDELDTSTFRPQRLNFTRSLPAEYVETFRQCLPEGYAPYIDDTYEVQVRTIFSEGWHEVEHDLRYKCKEDWAGCDAYSRTLNGVIATLETAEWSMRSLFQELARRNCQQGNFRAMFRNFMRLRLQGDGFSPRVTACLQRRPELAEGILQADRMVLVLALLQRQEPMTLTYDNLLFFINRFEGQDEELEALAKEAGYGN